MAPCCKSPAGVRAWVAGCWVREVLEGRRRVPVPHLDIPNRFYAVARSADGSQPEIYRSKRDYFFCC